MTSPRYGSLAARTECNHCGAFLPLDAPLLEVSCPQCTEQVSVPASIWGAMLDELDEQIDQLAEGQGHTVNTVIGAQKLVYEIKHELPHCEKCNAPLAVADFPVGTSQNFACTQCGDPASTEPAPDWLVQVAPNARQLYRVDPDPALAGSGAVALTPAAAPRPIALACPSCGAGLQITVDHPRLTPCRFCGADVYLPDAVWRKLHPVKVVTPFYVRFEGPTKRARLEMEQAHQAELQAAELARQAEARAAELTRQAEMRAAGQARAAKADRQTAAAQRWGWLFSLLAAASAAALVSWSWSPWLGLHGVGHYYSSGMLVLGVVTLGTAAVGMRYGLRLVEMRAGKTEAWAGQIVLLVVPVVGILVGLGQGFLLFAGQAGWITKQGDSVHIDKAGWPAAIVYLALGLTQAALWTLSFMHG